MDVVVAIDASGDIVNNWPNGTSLLMSASRITNMLQSSHQPFPPLPGNAEQFLSAGLNMRPTFYGCFPTQNPPEYPIVIHFPNSPPINGDSPVTNPGIFKLDYSLKHTQLFLDQIHANTIGGFLPNTTSPDPNFGKCLQCVAIDRARYRASPTIDRSAFCTQCFQQYCFDPKNLTSVKALPGRKFVFVDPDPQGISAVKNFLSEGKVGFILGFLGLAIVIAAISAFLILRKRRQGRRHSTYEQVQELHDDTEEEPPFVHHNRYRDSSTSETSYELGERIPEPEMPYVPEEHQ